jgi:hypothetical protein
MPIEALEHEERVLIVEYHSLQMRSNTLMGSSL